MSFAAGPHLGSEVAQKLQESDPDLVEQALKEVVLNGELDFRNADGSRVDVTGEEPVFAQLVPNSVFLQNLNFEAANRHAQFSYRTVAGTERGDSFEAFNRVLGVFADDGLVNVESANAQVIGPVTPLAGALTDAAGDAEVTVQVPAGLAPFVRAEVRRTDGQPELNPLAGVPGLAMVALTNPVFLGARPGTVR